MTVKEIIDDVKIKLNDTQELYRRNWLLHLVDCAVKDIARESYYWAKEVTLKLDPRYNSLDLPADFLKLRNIRFSSDGVKYQPIKPMTKAEERERDPIVNQQSYQNKNWFNWIPNVMPDRDIWGMVKNGNVLGDLKVGEFLNIDLEVGQYLYFEKVFSITAQEGWTIEGNVVLPNEISGGGEIEGLTNNIFSVTDDKGGVSISLWTLPNYTKIWLEIDTENGTEEIECSRSNEIQFKISGNETKYDITIINKTASKTYSYTLNRTFSNQTARLTFGGELTGTVNPDYPVNAHKGLKWKALYLVGVSGLDYSKSSITLFTMQTRTLIFDCAVRNGWILLDYSYTPAKIVSETDTIDISDNEIIVYYVLARIQKGTDLLLAKEEYRDRLLNLTEDPYQKPFENLWIPGGGY